MIAPFTNFASSKRGKWIVIAVWFILTALIVPLSPRLDEVVRNESGDFLPEGAESTQVEELVAAEFPSDGLPAILVFRNPDGLSDADQAGARRVSDQLVSETAPENINGVISVFTRPEAAASLVSADGTTMTMVANITGEPAEQPYANTIAWIRDQPTSTGGLAVKVSGPGGLLADLIKVFERIDGFLLLVTASLVLVLLVLIYRSPVVALVPLVSVGWVFSLAGALGALLAEQVGLPVNSQSQGIMTVLLFGAGTDYCLFVSSRYREELAHVEDKHEAMRRVTRGVGKAIASSVGTVLIATLALLLAVLRSTQTLGPLLALAVGLMLIASLTLVPAILTVLGRWNWWPGQSAGHGPATSGETAPAGE
ncbi:MAG: MMPL family transporter [Thermomicrobiales bacterium]